MVVPSITNVLEALGYKVWLDLDGDLQYEAPAEVTREQITKLLRLHVEAIEWDLRWRYHRDRRRFVGGPLNGEKIVHHFRGSGCTSAIPIKLGRAKWAAYRRGLLDERAFYAGEATSQKAARKLAWAFKPPIGADE